MTATHVLSLNPEQRDAVEHLTGPLLVIAGAGSGKTRVLTARVARLIERGVAPERILSFTFTNRAAREMRERLERSVGTAAATLWMGTFHATGVRMLRREAATLGLPAAFTVYDREDQESVLRELLKEIERTDETARVGQVLARISDAKNALASPEDMARTAASPQEARTAEIFARYQRALRANGALDFDDLIAESARLLSGDGEVAARWRRRFEHVLVDEYQDTNHAQFRLVQSLASGHGNLFVVGDDDQSIYGWRGADLSNVLEFEQAFPGARVIRLEQNYRSTSNILGAANAVIENNRSRKGKRLWCEREAGERLRFVLGADEVEEARRVRGALTEWRRRGRALSDCAVLYRTNAQSRAIEADLRQHLVPYEIVGGVSFFQRREVKDLVAYLRVAVNPTDTVAFWRVWNTPRRGLGPGVRSRVEQRMAETRESAEAALRSLAGIGDLPRAAAQSAVEFLGVLEEVRANADQPADRVLSRVLERTRYLDHLERGDEDADERRANVEELVASAAESVDRRGASLVDFLAETALFTDVDRMRDDEDRVRLLTAHNAKGLEFGAVVIAGLEEGLLPHGASMDDGPRLEEERRLFYVALTRARDEVLLTAAAYRRRFDGARGSQVSRFVAEIPDELIDRERLPEPRWSHAGTTGRNYGGGRRGRDSGAGEDAALDGAIGMGAGRLATTRHRTVGRTVYHETFGRGVVTAAEGDGPDARLTVRFTGAVKKVVARFLSGEDDVDPA